VSFDLSVISSKNIILAVTGGIAAYKSAILVRRLKDYGFDVRVVMTQGAQAFITDLQECFSIISKPLLEISSQIAYLKEQSKGKKKSTSKKSNTKKKNQKLKIHQMENLTEKEKSLKYSELIIFLFNEYIKTKNQDEIIDEFIEDDEDAK